MKLVIDTLDDRREVWSLLHRLPPRDRVRFLAAACARVPVAAGRLPVPVVTHLRETIDRAHRCDRADARLTNELYCDLVALMNQWSLDAAATAALLEQWVKRPDLRRVPSSSSSGPHSAAPARTPCSSGSDRRR